MIKGAGLGKGVLLITDGRFSRRHHRLCIGHIAPRPPTAGRIALIRDGDSIHPGHEQPRAEPGRAARRVGAPPRRLATGAAVHPRGVLGKYAKLVSSAAQGAVCG